MDIDGNEGKRETTFTWKTNRNSALHQLPEEHSHEVKLLCAFEFF